MLADQQVREAWERLKTTNRMAIAQATGLSPDKVRHALDRLRLQEALPAFERADLPSDIPDVEELLEARRRSYRRTSEAYDARKLIPVQVNLEGPIGIVHMGDPHVDDPGTNIELLETHVRVINETEGLFGANVGDASNNWTQRLAHLYGEQSTTAREAWVLVEWLLNSTEWLYLVGGNHDVWQQGTEVIRWMLRQGNIDEWGARLSLQFSNGKEVRVNARHDFRGRSMWNAVHGPAKAAMMGWRDHILVAGHTHQTGWNVLKDPASGLISHAIRVASYKKYDRYAVQEGLPDQAISPAITTIIDPQYEDDDPRLITTLLDVEEAADYLTWKRQKSV